ncbi:MAG: hypothetical protein HKN68_16970 [Saprospiraceae bacterium]|nr:hypothetical protein [Saprospiraceae bacterium]
MTKRDKYYQLLDQYVKGNLSTQERHDLEKKALDDPFFFEAMEGWVKMGNADHAVHLDRLQKKINRKSQTTLAKRILWPVTIAASLLLLFTIGNIMVNNEDSTLASVTSEEKDEKAALSIVEEDETLENEIPSKEEIVSEDKPVAAITTDGPAPPPAPVKENQITLEKKRKDSSTGSRDIASVNVEGMEEVAAVDAEEKESIPSGNVEAPQRMPLANVNNSMMNNTAQRDMSMSGVGIIDIIDPDLDNHIKQNLFMRALKVPSGQKVAFDLTFDSSLTLTEIKTVSESNKLSENIKEFIESYTSWKKETIPPNLFGRYNYPPK